MMVFLIGAVLLLALAMSFLLWPLLRGGPRVAGRDRAIVSLYRDQFRELSADHAAGSISDEQYESGRRELERRLLDEVAQPTSGSGASRKTGLIAAGIGAFVLVVPVGLYLALGTPAAISPVPSESQAAGERGSASDGEKAAPHPITPEQVQVMADKLTKHLEQSPRDGEGWAMLARTYSYLHKFPEAVKAYAKAAELLPNDSHLFADYADALAMTKDRRLTGEPMKLIQRSLAIDPKDVKALALAGSEAFDRHDYKAAVGFWDRAVKASGPQDAQFAEQLRSSLDEARQLAGIAPPPMAGEASASEMAAPVKSEAAASSVDSAPASAGAAVKGRVRLAAALAGKAAPNDTLFVFARATQGPRMPLALIKRSVKDLPLEFALDDSMAMMPNLKLSNYSSVVIGARVSHGGDAMPTSGDLQGFSPPVKVGSSGIDVQIDQVVP